jgi:hypothetical protein
MPRWVAFALAVVIVLLLAVAAAILGAAVMLAISY